MTPCRLPVLTAVLEEIFVFRTDFILLTTLVSVHSRTADQTFNYTG